MKTRDTIQTMIQFEIIKKSKKSNARVGLLRTPHGTVETPAFVPVATQAVVKTLTSEEVVETNSQILISNTFHLHLKPGEQYVKAAGGIHEFMNWKKPLMTDSAGFQVFSLGFGRDFNVGKVLKYFPSEGEAIVQKNAKPKSLQITESGVWFHSPIDGRKLFIGPKESIRIQQSIGADIIFNFDECTPPLCSYDYAKQALERTHRWAKVCLDTRSSKQALFGIVQGSKYKDLRTQSADFINSLEFDGYGIGGDMGESKKISEDILSWTLPRLDPNKPRHLLGIGYLSDMELVVKHGVDLFDCTVPTHYARHKIAFTNYGKLDMSKSAFLKDKNPLDKKCLCMVCQVYKRNYICHLIKAKEITGMKLLTFHNLFYYNSYVEAIRTKIKEGKL